MGVSENLRARLRAALGSGPARDELISAMVGGTAKAGPTIYVEGSTGYGSDTQNDGLSTEKPFATMAGVMSYIGTLNTRYKSDGIIVARGLFAEHVTAPLGAYGWTIISAAGGMPRHATSSGVFLNSNGCHWKANAGGAPLLELREQGWSVIGLLMVPQSGYSAIKHNRQESATYPDASHSVITYNKFVAPSTRAGYGIEDYGGLYHTLVENNEFESLEFAFNPTNVSVDSPTSHVWRNNRFMGNKHDIVANAKGWLIEGNYFKTPYDGTTHPNTVNLAYTTDAGSATQKNIVKHNTFADIAADVTIANGYKPATGDIWRNYVTNTADEIVTVPT